MSEKVVVYVPSGAKINTDLKPMEEPKLEYNKRKSRFDLERTKKLTGGEYGRNARYKKP
jgi:hypothetical protein